MTSGTNGPSHAPSPRATGAFSGLTDEECARLAREGSGEALAELVHRYSAGVFHLLVRLLQDRESASDATQEVFLRAQRHLRRFDPDRSFRKWLFAIGWNLGRDVLRRRRRRREAKIVSLERFRSGQDDATGRFEPADERGLPPDELLDSKDRALWVRQALDGLEPTQRALLVLREYEGFSYEELADLMQCRLGTVKSRLHRARMELKDSLRSLRPHRGDRRSSGAG